MGVCVSWVSFSPESSNGLFGSTGLIVSPEINEDGLAMESFEGFFTSGRVIGFTLDGDVLTAESFDGTIGEAGAIDFGLAGRYLRSNGFPEFCPQATIVMATRMVIPRKRFMAAKVATPEEFSYYLHESLSRIEVSPATSRPAVVPSDFQISLWD